MKWNCSSPNFNGATVEVLEMISIFSRHLADNLSTLYTPRYVYVYVPEDTSIRTRYHVTVYEIEVYEVPVPAQLTTGNVWYHQYLAWYMHGDIHFNEKVDHSVTLFHGNRNVQSHFQLCKGI